MSGQKFIKKAKNGVLENLKFAVKQSYQTAQYRTKIAENCWKMPKLKNSNATFWVIFKHCGEGPKCAEFLIVCKNDVSYTLALPKEGKIFFFSAQNVRRPAFALSFFSFLWGELSWHNWEGQGRGTTESNGESAIIPALELPEVRPRPRKWFIRYLKLRYWELSLNFSFLRYHHIWLKNHSTLYKWKSFEL